MNVLVIGAAGKTGQAVVEQALAAGHKVTAFVHRAATYSRTDVRVVEGDATDRRAMDTAVRGQDAVLDTIGGKTPYKTTTLESDTAHAIIAAMRQHKVRRLVVTSMLGVGDSVANSTWFLRLLVATFLRGADKDKTAMEKAVSASGLDWVILRPAILDDDPSRGEVHIFPTATGQKAHKITRTDLATFMVAQLTNDEHLGQTLAIANS